MESGDIISILLGFGLCFSFIFNIIQYYTGRKLRQKILLIECSRDYQLDDKKTNEEKIEEEIEEEKIEDIINNRINNDIDRISKSNRADVIIENYNSSLDDDNNEYKTNEYKTNECKTNENENDRPAIILLEESKDEEELIFDLQKNNLIQVEIQDSI
jgi:hypothetical protein